MRMLKNLAVTLIGFGFLAMGIFILATDKTGEDTMLGSIVILFFGVVGLVGLMDLLPTTQPKAQPDGRYLVTASRLRTLVFAFGGLAFAVAGVVMPLGLYLSGEFSIKALIGALGLPFGLGVLWFALRQLGRSGPLYILDADGIESRTGLEWRLAWRDIAGIGVGSAGQNRWLMFETFPHVPDPCGAITSINRRFNMPPYALTTGTSGVNFDALADLVHALWSAQHPPAAPE